MRTINKQRKVTLLILSFALVIAVYLNWQYSKAGTSDFLTSENLATQTNAQVDETDMLLTQEDYETKNYGDAQLVSTANSDSEKYFEQARLSRQKTRDEALDTLQKTLKNSKLTDAEKKDATAQISQIIQDMTSETDIENMVKAKGFSDCVATIGEGKISLAVQGSSGELTKQDVAKIRDIVLSKTTITSQNIVIVDVK